MVKTPNIDRVAAKGTVFLYIYPTLCELAEIPTPDNLKDISLGDQCADANAPRERLPSPATTTTTTTRSAPSAIATSATPTAARNSPTCRRMPRSSPTSPAILIC